MGVRAVLGCAWFGSQICALVEIHQTRHGASEPPGVEIGGLVVPRSHSSRYHDALEDIRVKLADDLLDRPLISRHLAHKIYDIVPSFGVY